MKALAAALLTLLLVSSCSAAATTTRAAPTRPMISSKTAPHRLPTPSTAHVDRTRHSLTDPTSIWVIVNKSHPISPLDFRPPITLVRGYQVAAAAAAPLARLLDMADRAGIPIKIASAFRSYDYQLNVHEQLVARIGMRAADAVSARPGFSEHQTGLAVDLEPADGTCALESCFARTEVGRWLANNAWEFGFVARYTKANRSITHYSPEPWHFRYVGKPLARELHQTSISSLEQFFGVKG